MNVFSLLNHFFRENEREKFCLPQDRTVSRLMEIVPKEGLIYLGEEDFRVKKREEKVAYFEQIR